MNSTHPPIVPLLADGLGQGDLSRRDGDGMTANGMAFTIAPCESGGERGFRRYGIEQGRGAPGAPRRHDESAAWPQRNGPRAPGL